MSEPTSKERVSLGAQQSQSPPANLPDAMQAQPAPQVYNVPVQTVALPSQGKTYPAESPLHGLKNVEIRSMTARDEDILTSRALLKQGKAISSLLKNCLMDKSIDPDGMLVGDRNAILVALRASGYGREYETKVECPSCEEEFESSFDLGSMEVIPLKAEPVTSGDNLFAFALPMSKQEVTFRLLTGNDERELTKHLEKLKKARGIGAVEEGVTLRLFYQIVSLAGETDKAKLSRMIKNMIAGDSRALRSHISKISPGLDLKGNVECLSCGEESEVEMPMGVDFFWPGND
jgi:hypothetical protein